MGLLLVTLDAVVGDGWDLVPDPFGWVLVIVGLRPLRGVLPQGPGLLTLAGLALLVSVALFPPAVLERTDESLQWMLSLPGLAVSVGLCTSLAAVAGPDTRGRFLLLRAVFAAAAVLPVLIYGGGVDLLVVPVAVALVVANLSLVYLVFRVARRPQLHPA